MLANLVYALTDPPLRVIRRRVPMARLGGVGIDLSFLVLVFGIWIIQWFLGASHLNRCEVASEPLECCSHVNVR